MSVRRPLHRDGLLSPPPALPSPLLTMPDAARHVLGYLFRDADLLREALTHASSADHRLKSNERLEFLGDAILGYVVCEELYRAYPGLLEGDLTKIKSAVVSRRVCAKVTRSIRLEELLNLGKGMSSRPGLPPSVAAAVFESIIAAIYLDGGMDPARDFILRHLRPYIEDAANSEHQQNFKSVLQQLTQQCLDHPVAYVLLDAKGPDHAKAFEVCVEIDGRRFAPAWANNKKQAEQAAALAALRGLGLVVDREGGEAHLVEDPAPVEVAARLAALPPHDTTA